MKPVNEPMRLEDVHELLRSASKLTNHRNFVIVGSLSSIGSLVSPPDSMVCSRDIDLYLKQDPGRAFIEVAQHLAEGSEFHAQHGFYADPVSPSLISAPENWENRLVPITFQDGLVAWFMDLTDAACSKLIRGQSNDRIWVESGLRDGALDAETLRERLGRCARALDGEVERARSLLVQIINGDRTTSRVKDI